LTTERQKDAILDKGISDIVGVFFDPIIVFPGGWGDTLPEWLKHAITMERLVMNMKALKGEEVTGTDAEACAYLYTACLTQPMDHDWGQIYLYVAGKVYKGWRSKDSGMEFPEDIRVESLTKEQENDLNRLKEWIYRTRTRARQDKDKAERRQRREEEAAKRKAEQPALFTF
jgi:hypothetical protein